MGAPPTAMVGVPSPEPFDKSAPRARTGFVGGVLAAAQLGPDNRKAALHRLICSACRPPVALRPTPAYHSASDSSVSEQGDYDFTAVGGGGGAPAPLVIDGVVVPPPMATPPPPVPAARPSARPRPVPPDPNQGPASVKLLQSLVKMFPAHNEDQLAAICR